MGVVRFDQSEYFNPDADHLQNKVKLQVNLAWPLILSLARSSPGYVPEET